MPVEEVLTYPLKLFCRHICDLPTTFFFKFFHSGIIVVKIVLQTTSEEKVARIKIGGTCWPNTTTDNSVSEDIKQNLHRYAEVGQNNETLQTLFTYLY
jgi:hypothetical protein